MNEINQKYRDTLTRLKSIRREAQSLRDEFLAKRVAMYMALEEKGKAKIVQRLIRVESQTKVYQKIKYIRNQNDGALGLSTLKIPRHFQITDTDKLKTLPILLTTGKL